MFIVQKEEQDTRGSNIRYMVETARPKYEPFILDGASVGRTVRLTPAARRP